MLGAATALALALTATNSAPAFAVARNADGTVTVTIHDVAGVGGANTLLAALDVSVRAVPAVRGCPAPAGRQPESLFADRALRLDPASSSVTIVPSAIPAGDTLVLAATETSSDHVALGVTLVRGPAPACSDQALRSRPAAP